MLGTDIADPDGIEGTPCTVKGLGLLNIKTLMKPQKRLAQSTATHLATGTQLKGYEIHIGETTGPDCENAWLSIDGRPEGAASANGQIKGCYLHGLFSSDSFRQSFLEGLGKPMMAYDYTANVESTLDALAAHLETHMDLDALLKLAGEV